MLSAAEAASLERRTVMVFQGYSDSDVQGYQAIKYFIDPFSIRDELFFISERKWTLKEDIAKNIRKTFPNIDLKIIQPEEIDQSVRIL